MCSARKKNIKKSGERDTHLNGLEGFKEFHLVKGETNNEYSLYASHCVWKSKNDFIRWTKSEAFKLARKNTGQHRDLYLVLQTLRVSK